MRLVFMGTPAFALPTLEALLAAGHEIACVYCQPPRPAGRGQRERPSPVHARAGELGIEVRHPTSLKQPDAQAAFAALRPDAAVVVAYGLILPAPVLAAPRLGCINLHGSLLPRWRGAAPMQRAIMAGDAETGVTTMLMDAGLDTGPMLLRRSVAIGPATTLGDLHDGLAELGAGMIVASLAGLADGSLAPTPQPADGVTYARKIDRAETRIDWSRPAAELDRLVRGLSPVPGAWFELEGERIRLLLAEPTGGDGPPGTLLDDRLAVACGSGALRLARLQRGGRAAMDAGAFLRGRPVPTGTRLD